MERTPEPELMDGAEQAAAYAAADFSASDGAVVARLQELAAVEQAALSGVLASPELVRMHSVGVCAPSIASTHSSNG